MAAWQSAERYRLAHMRARQQGLTAKATQKVCQLLAAVAALGSDLCGGVRVVAEAGRLGCPVLVWDAARMMPPAAAERRAPTGQRA